MQLFNKLSRLSDKLLPHTEFTTPLPIEVCQERLENGLDLQVLPKRLRKKSYKTSVELTEGKSYTFSIDMANLRIVGHLESLSDLSTHIKAKVEIHTQARLLRFVSLFIGFLWVFIWFDGFSNDTFSSDGLRFIIYCLVLPTLLSSPFVIYIVDPLDQREKAKKFLKAIENTLKSE